MADPGRRKMDQGGSGVNDIHNSYNVTGIGINRAAKIVYHTQNIIYGSQIPKEVNFSQFRNATINATRTLYGTNSIEEIAVTNAWYAVGLGTEFPPYITSTSNIICEGDEVEYTLNNFPPNATISWTGTSTLSLISGQGTPNARFRAQNNPTISHVTSVRVTINNSATINGPAAWVGAPKGPEDGISLYIHTGIYTPHFKGTDSNSYFIFDYPGNYYVSQYHYMPNELTTIADIRLSSSAGLYTTEAINQCGSWVNQEWIGVSSYSIFPNPTTGIFTIKKEVKNLKKEVTYEKGTANELLLLRFYTLPMGEVIKELKIELKDETPVNISDLPNGNYILSIIKDKKIIDSKNVTIRR